jgi:hypothetical protein
MLLFPVSSLFAAPSLLSPASFRYALLRGRLLISYAHACLRVQTRTLILTKIITSLWWPVLSPQT